VAVMEGIKLRNDAVIHAQTPPERKILNITKECAILIYRFYFTRFVVYIFS
jgi:hypothetical protein